MILIEIRDFIKMHQEVTLTQLSRHFDVAPDAMKDMVNRWVMKGFVSQMIMSDNCNTNSSCSSGCGSCTVAKPGETVSYRWLNR